MDRIVKVLLYAVLAATQVVFAVLLLNRHAHGSAPTAPAHVLSMRTPGTPAALIRA